MTIGKKQPLDGAFSVLHRMITATDADDLIVAQNDGHALTGEFIMGDSLSLPFLLALERVMHGGTTRDAAIAARMACSEIDREGASETVRAVAERILSVVMSGSVVGAGDADDDDAQEIQKDKK